MDAVRFRSVTVVVQCTRNSNDRTMQVTCKVLLYGYFESCTARLLKRFIRNTTNIRDACFNEHYKYQLCIGKDSYNQTRSYARRFQQILCSYGFLYILSYFRSRYVVHSLNLYKSCIMILINLFCTSKKFESVIENYASLRRLSTNRTVNAIIHAFNPHSLSTCDLISLKCQETSLLI